MGKVKIVTGYIPIETPHRSVQEYRQLGMRLKAVPVPMQVFDEWPLAACWMNKFLHQRMIKQQQIGHAVGDNPGKNTMAYHVVQHQKIDWLRHAANLDPYQNMYVWIDYGIFSLPGVTRDIIVEFCERLADEERICIPGCWPGGPLGAPNWPDDKINWRFCGSVLACPGELVHKLDFLIKERARHDIYRTHAATWEVNTWAKVERENSSLPIHWYPADHNATLFTGYRGPR